MVDRPQWVRSITHFLGDEIMADEKHGYPDDDSGDDLLDEIESAVNEILCEHYGHEIEDDQCMIPEHRYCIWCGLRETTLANDKRHQIELRDDGWVIMHPISERVDGTLFDCTAVWDNDDLGVHGRYYLDWDEAQDDWVLGEETDG